MMKLKKNIRSHIESERPEREPYKYMSTLTSKTCFRVMRGCQEQIREGDLGGSLEFGWTGESDISKKIFLIYGL